MTRDRDGKELTAATTFIKMATGAIPRVVWSDFAWIHNVWRGPIIIKGIMTVDDAWRAVDAGAEAIVVSNHGGMVNDGLPATLRMLPVIVDAMGYKVEVLFDGGVQRGLDVVKALALGARAVLIGHGYLWPLAAAGEPGVKRMLELFRMQIAAGLHTVGVDSVRALDRSVLVDLPTQIPAPLAATRSKEAQSA